MKISPINQNPIYNAQKSPKAPSFCAAVPTKAVKNSKIIDGILKNKAAQWAFKFASKNSFGFSVLALAISCMIFRPITIMALPGQKKDDKEYLAAKAIIASAIADAGRILFILPLGIAMDKWTKTAKKAEELVDKQKLEKLGKEAQNKAIAIRNTKYDAFNFAANNVFSVILSIGTAALMTIAIPKVMSRILPPPNKNNNLNGGNTKIKTGGTNE